MIDKDYLYCPKNFIGAIKTFALIEMNARANADNPAYRHCSDQCYVFDGDSAISQTPGQ